MKNPKNSAASAAAKRIRKTNQDLQIEALSKRVNKLETALDTNTQVFSDALKVLEIKQNVMEDIITTLYQRSNGDANIHVTQDGKVDFGYYLKRYLEKLGAQEAQADAPAPAPAIVTPDDESPTIFGGDGP